MLTVDQYVARRLTRTFVRTAREMNSRHQALLKKVSAKYGVPPRIIVAVWGLESNFGRFSGVRPTVQALATLAWEGRRGAFFRGELLDALEIVDRGYIDLDALTGSWAGAMGQTQFMPSSYLKWAQDFDADGRRDIWRSNGDVFASIANYLREHGWSKETTWGREVKVAASALDRLRETAGMRTQGCRAVREMTERLPLAKWQSLGVRTLTGGRIAESADRSLVDPHRAACVSRLRQLRRAPRIQLRAHLRACGGAAQRADRGLIDRSSGRVTKQKTHPQRTHPRGTQRTP